MTLKRFRRGLPWFILAVGYLSAKWFTSSVLVALAYVVWVFIKLADADHVREGDEITRYEDARFWFFESSSVASLAVFLAWTFSLGHLVGWINNTIAVLLDTLYGPAVNFFSPPPLW